MGNFREKAIFVWQDNIIGDAAKIVQLLRDGNFEAALLHSTHTTNWRTTSRIALVQALKAAGIRVYASCAVYATQTPAKTEGEQAAAIVNDYGLDGMVFDVEAGNYESASNAAALVKTLLDAYRDKTTKTAAFCGWPYYHSTANPNQIYHPVAVLIEAMKHDAVEVGMPMAYWYNGETAAHAEQTATQSYNQWRRYTSKPLVMAGRAYTDTVKLSDGTSRTIRALPDAVLAFDARSRELGAAGITWWDMEHALKIPDVWAALTATPKIGNQPIPKPEEHMWKDKAMLLVTKNDAWTNPDFAGIVGYACAGIEQPNPALKAIELKAREQGKPFGILYDFSMAQYTRDQVPRDPALWPPYHLDYPLQAFWDAVKNRDVDFVVIRVLDPNDHTGQPGDQGWVSYAAETFINNAYNLIKANKPEVKLVVASNNSFIATYAPAINNWIGKADRVWDLWIDQLVPAHDESFPRATDKPAYLGAAEDTAARKAWQLWRYWPTPGMGLVLFNGTEEQFRGWSGAPVQDPGDDDDQGDDDNQQSTDLAQVLELLRALHEQNNLILARLDLIDAGQDELARDHERIAADAAATRAHFR